MTQGVYSIKDLEKLTGIKAHTLRIWEKRYRVVNPSRTSTNIRYYCDDDLKRLINISTLLKHGFKISKIANLSDEQLGEKIMNFSVNPYDTDTQIDNLIVAMIELDDAKFEKTISSATLSLGFEKTVIEIIYPFLEKIGILWLTGTIKPAQEHFISNLLRQKILVAIDSLSTKPNPDAKRFMLFLRENELHEMGLLFYSYLVKKSGHKIIYLGQSVPFNDLIEVAKFKEPDYLLTALISPMSSGELKEYLSDLSGSFKKQTIYITGRLCQDYPNTLPPNVKILSGINELKEVLNNI